MRNSYLQAVSDEAGVDIDVTTWALPEKALPAGEAQIPTTPAHEDAKSLFPIL